MKRYIKNIIPRLKQFSENLDKQEIFVEIPWINIDNNLNQQKYIFKRNGDFVMSMNGQVSIGKWEYLSAARCLLIDRIQDKILLNQYFIDPAVMVLKKDGFKDENLILANELLLPELNVADYLKQLYYKRNNISVRQLNTGEYLEVHGYEGWKTDNMVTIEGMPIPDGYVQLLESDKKFVIKDSRVVKVLVKETYNTNRGKIVIEHQEYMNPSIGDFVFQNNTAAPDGKYKLGLMRHIVVYNGRIFPY